MIDRSSRRWVPISWLQHERDQGPVIVVWDGVFSQVQQHAAANCSREVAGFLLGQVRDLPGEMAPVVVVDASVEAKHTLRSATHVEFTHETWTTLHAEREQYFGNRLVTGWYHTHPALGVFLSSYDVFIHESFFRQPYHVALVMDPVRNHSGFFKWVDGRLDSQRYYGFTEKSALASPTLNPGENMWLPRAEEDRDRSTHAWDSNLEKPPARPAEALETDQPMEVPPLIRLGSKSGRPHTGGRLPPRPSTVYVFVKVGVAPNPPEEQVHMGKQHYCELHADRATMVAKDSGEHMAVHMLEDADFRDGVFVCRFCRPDRGRVLR